MSVQVNEFDDVEGADLSGTNRAYFEEGIYTAKIVGCKYKPEAKTFKKNASYIVEFEIMESTNPKRGPGQIVGYVAKKKNKDGTPNTFYYANLTGLFAAAFQAKKEDVNKEVLFACQDPVQQIANGKVVKVIAVTIDLNTSGQGPARPFTQIEFKPYEQAEESAA